MALKFPMRAALLERQHDIQWHRDEIQWYSYPCSVDLRLRPFNIVGNIAAFVVFFLAFVAPRLPEAAARAEALRVQEIAQENEWYCAKWQMGLGTKMHDQCISDLQELRSKIQDRLADQLDF